jgi:hypothetical protein
MRSDPALRTVTVIRPTLPTFASTCGATLTLTLRASLRAGASSERGRGVGLGELLAMEEPGAEGEAARLGETPPDDADATPVPLAAGEGEAWVQPTRSVTAIATATAARVSPGGRLATIVGEL